MSSVEAVLEKLRASLKRRGAEGIRGLGRHFKIVDRDRSGSLDFDEFAQACRINNLGLSDAEQRVLMKAFDVDGNGTVGYEEFLRGVRGRRASPARCCSPPCHLPKHSPRAHRTRSNHTHNHAPNHAPRPLRPSLTSDALRAVSPVRKKSVRQIFDALDALGGQLGYLTIEVLKPIYSVSNHPAVKAGKMTKDEALQELLNGFEGSQGNRDGKVSLEEWIRYYEEVSVSIDSDDYFGTMLSGTWAHLKRRSPDGKTAPVLKFTARADVERLEKALINQIFSKAVSDTQLKRQVEAQFAQFDVDKSGNVDIDEFCKALEKFGMHVAGRRAGVGGVPMDVVQGLYDKYDVDSSGARSPPLPAPALHSTPLPFRQTPHIIWPPSPRTRHPGRRHVVVQGVCRRAAGQGRPSAEAAPGPGDAVGRAEQGQGLPGP